MANYSKCDNCNKVFPTADIVALEDTEDLGSRLDPGKVVPSGDCPECGAFCYLYTLPALVLEDPSNQDESGRREYLMTEWYNSVWISVDKWSVHIGRGYGSQCPLVEVSKRGKEAE